MSVINCAVRFAHCKDLACGRAGIPITVENAQDYLFKKTGKMEDRGNIANTFKQLATEWKGMIYTNATVVYENDRVRELREKREAEAAAQRKQEEITAAEKIANDLIAAAEQATAKLRLLRAA